MNTFGVNNLEKGIKPCVCGRPFVLKRARPAFVTGGGSCRGGRRSVKFIGNRRTTFCGAGAESGTVPGSPGCEYAKGSVLKVMIGKA